MLSLLTGLSLKASGFKTNRSCRGLSVEKTASNTYLVSVDQGVDTANLAKLNVGAVDLLGRRKMSKFVAKLLGVPKVKVKRVTKLEDLLPLLQFSMADAVMLPPDKVETFRSKSALNLQVTTINAATVGLPSVSVLSGGQRQIVIDALQKVNPQVMTRMGLDVWKKAMRCLVKKRLVTFWQASLRERSVRGLQLLFGLALYAAPSLSFAERILILMPDLKPAQQIYGSLSDELAGEYEVEQLLCRE